MRKPLLRITLTALITMLMVLLCSMALADAPGIITEALPIQVNTDYSDNIAERDDVDYFKFTLSEPGPVSLTFSHEYEDVSIDRWQVAFLDSDGESFMSRYFAPNALHPITTCELGLPAGTFYVKINRDTYWSNYCDKIYTFKINFSSSPYWEKEWNGNISSNSTPIELNTTYSGNIGYRDDEDYYNFTLPSDGPVSISFSHVYQSIDETRWTVRILNVNGDEMFSRDFNPSQVLEVTTSKLGLPAGKYFIKITKHYLHYYFTDVRYSFTVNYTASSVWETEDNSNPVYSNDPIVLDTQYSGSISNRDDLDYYRFEIQTAGIYGVDFFHDFVDTSDPRWILKILDNNLGELVKYYYKGNETETTSNEISLQPGTYYVLVTRDNRYYASSDATYSFAIKSPEMPKPISISDATISKIGSQIYTGSAIQPQVTVKYQDETLVRDTDYTVSYENNVNVGKAKVIVTGIGRFNDNSSVSFVINPARVSLSSLKAGKKTLTVKWKKCNGIDGYEIQYSLKKSFSGSKKLTVSKASAAKATIKGLKAKKTYYVRIRSYKKVGGKKYYSEWSKVLKKKTK